MGVEADRSIKAIKGLIFFYYYGLDPLAALLLSCAICVVCSFGGRQENGKMNKVTV